jgi:hypothetical protein
MSKPILLAIPMLIAFIAAPAAAETPQWGGLSYQEAKWHPLHFKPAAETASNDDCLTCHAGVLEQRVRDETPAGVKAGDTLAWYETLDTYEGDEETFHRRHMVTDYANQVMSLKCNTCHVGNDPREEAGLSYAGGDTTLTLRKQVDPNTCLLCHGQFPYQNMGVPGPWLAYAEAFQNNCLLCHVTFRTNRHQVNYLKPAAIEALAAEKQDVCFGCHGGRSWYRISYPYPRHPWPGMPEIVPDWAKDRPAESQARFLIGVEQAAAPVQPPASVPVPDAAPDTASPSAAPKISSTAPSSTPASPNREQNR